MSEKELFKKNYINFIYNDTHGYIYWTDKETLQEIENKIKLIIKNSSVEFSIIMPKKLFWHLSSFESLVNLNDILINVEYIQKFK